MLFFKTICCISLIISITHVTANEDISFKDVEIEWRSGSEQHSTKVASSNSLKENVQQNVSSIKVIGSVPVLYKNAITDIYNLTTLTLDSLGLEKLEPGAFNHLKTNVLSLSSNKFKELHQGVFEDMSVTNLQIYNGDLERIEPGVFTSMDNLKSLTLSENKLREIDEEVFNNPHVENLDLQFNSISSIRPGALQHLPKLRTLQLTANKLKEVPASVFNNLHIEDLRLNYNEISNIDSKAFDDMPNLSILHIDNNKLRHWDNNWLHNCPKLAYVIARFNEIEKIPEEAFKNYPKIYSIDLEHNKIKSISPKAMITSKSIVNFNLSDNEIEDWDENLLGNVTISTVYLDRNRLKCIRGDLKIVFRTVYSAVHLSGNPWDADCPSKTDYIDRPGSPPKPEDL